jgi:hypothetical protein
MLCTCTLVNGVKHHFLSYDRIRSLSEDQSMEVHDAFVRSGGCRLEAAAPLSKAFCRTREKWCHFHP